MAPNLAPTQVIDKNGRSTTVHKRLDAPQSASKMSNVPAPSIAPKAAASAAARTPLPMPEPLDETQHAAFLEWQDSELDSMRYRVEIKNTFKQRFDPVAEALVWRVIQSGKVPKETIGRFLGTFHTRRTRIFAKNFGYAQEEVLSQLTSSLLLAERLGTEYPESVMEGVPLNFASAVDQALVGYSYTGKKSDRVEATTITTEETLTSVAAVTAYILESRNRQDFTHYKNSTFVSVNGKKVEGIYIANRSLDAFLRENPHEAGRAIAYAAERGMGNTAKDTKQLIQHLHDTEGMGALTEGWL
jgi:hypothetical protein